MLGFRTSTGSSRSSEPKRPAACCWYCRGSSRWRPARSIDERNCLRSCSCCRRGRSQRSPGAALPSSWTWRPFMRNHALQHHCLSPNIERKHIRLNLDYLFKSNYLKNIIHRCVKLYLRLPLMFEHCYHRLVAVVCWRRRGFEPCLASRHYWRSSF